MEDVQALPLMIPQMGKTTIISLLTTLMCSVQYGAPPTNCPIFVRNSLAQRNYDELQNPISTRIVVLANAGRIEG